MKDGHEAEEEIRQFANKELGCDFKEEVWVNGDYLASLDGIDEQFLIEAKNSEKTYNELKNGDIPEHYWLQVQQQLYCSPAEVGYIVARNPKTGDMILSDLIEPDPNVMERISAAWEAFDAMPVPEGDLDLSDNLELRALFEQYNDLKVQADEIKAKMDAIKERLLSYAPERTVECSGHKIIYKKGAVRVDYRKACKDAKLALEPYEKQGDPTYAIKVAPSPFTADEENTDEAA